MRDSLVLHFEYIDEDELTLEEIGSLTLAMIKYTKDGTEPEFKDRALRLQWKAIKNRLDADAEAYEERCKVNRENGKLGGAPAGNQNARKNYRTVEETTETTERLKKQPKQPDIDIDTDIDIKKESEKEKKHRHGDHVLLTDKEYQKLCSDFGTDQTEAAINFLNDYIAEKGYKSKSHNLALRRWVFDAVSEKQRRTQTARSGTKFSNFKDNERNSNDLDPLQAAYLRKQDERIRAQA